MSGSLVSPIRLRFDFTHFSPLSKEEIQKIERLVNEKISENIKVETRITTLEEGLKEGAMAIFEEKYGEKVRLVQIGDFSKELCGGVHVPRTGQIGLFKIISESSIAAGLRRIEALTGEEALKHIQRTEDLVSEVQQALSTSRKEILIQIEKLKDAVKEKEKENKTLRQKLAQQKYQKGKEEVRTIKGISVLTQRVEGLDNTELRELADTLRQKIGSGVVILGEASKAKVFLVATVTKDLVERIKANEIIKEIAPLVGGGGGGRPDFAQAGGTKPEQLDQALEKSYSTVAEML